MRKQLALLFLLVTAAGHSAFAQAAGAPQRPLAAPGPGEIRGKLVDSASGRAVGSGSITVRRDSAFAGGTLPKEDGTFRVDGLAPGTYNIRIRALGHGQMLKSGIVITAEKPVVDLGVLRLSTVVTKLEGEQVIAEREETVVQPDRTSYSTKNMTSAAGGTAIDVLRNIPQVEVDGSNKVSLRGNGNVVIQINGRTTPIKGEQLSQFLSQMPANTVKTVEVAANPSAKDDPEGTAGIINILLNQEAELGLSGGVNASTSSTGQLGFGGNVGKQQGKVTGFGALYFNGGQSKNLGTVSRENITIVSPAFTETRSNGQQKPLFFNGNLRGEYRFNETDALTFDGYYFGGRFKSENASFYTDLSAALDPIAAFDQLNRSFSLNSGADIDFAFRRQGKPTAPQLTVEAEYSNNLSFNDVDLSGNVTHPGGSAPASIRTEHDFTRGTYPLFTSKVDYSYPFNPNTKLDIGAKYLDRTTTNDFTASYLTNGAFVADPARRTAFSYREHIGGAYALLSRRIGKLQSQAGVRLEEARTMFDLPLASLHFDKHYASAYPSAVLSYSLSDMRTVRTTYSRRVTRPYPFQLSPIEYRQDSRNVSRGNPDLGAEYTDAFDLSLTDAHSWGSLQWSNYARRTNNAVRYINYVDTAGISVGTYANLAHNQSLGSDVNVNLRKGAFQGGMGGGMSYYTSDAGNLSLTKSNLSTKAFSWNARLNGTWKFNNQWDAQTNANYRPATKTEGGSSLAFVGLNVGLRYKRWGDQGFISVRLSDPFKMTKFGYRTANGQVIENRQNFPQSRVLFISVSRNFGQALRLRAKTTDDANPSGAPSGTP